MADFHNKCFFGENIGMIVTSPSKFVPHVFIKCIKVKDDKTWEKPTKKEGKIIKLSIEEILCFLEVLKGNNEKWRGYHIFNDNRTEIYAGWEDKNHQVLQIKIGDYKTKFQFPNINFLTLLLDHILNEKIEFATSGSFGNEKEFPKTE